jgi:hypothetical protein
LPVAGAVSVLVPLIESRRAIAKRLDLLERTMQLLLLHDGQISMSERLVAGKRYVDLGGNGATAAYYEQLEEKFKSRVARGMALPEEEGKA